MTNVAAGVLMWIVMFFHDGTLDMESVMTYPYESMEACEQSAAVFIEMVEHNEELKADAAEQGYGGVLALCTDDPNPLPQTKTDQ